MTSRTFGSEKQKTFKWADLPTRKPLAVGSVLFVAAVVLWHTVTGTDVPPGAAGLLEALLYVCVGGYAATSAYEAVRPASRVRTGYHEREEEPHES